MSVYTSMYVWEVSNQKSTALLALLALADFANQETGECFPGVPTLAKMLRMGERNVQTLLRRLEKEKVITIVENGGQATGTGKTNRYIINGYKEWYQRIKKLSSSTNEGVQDSAPLDTKETSRGAIFGIEGVQDSAPKPSLEPLESKDIAQKSTVQAPNNVIQFEQGESVKQSKTRKKAKSKRPELVRPLWEAIVQAFSYNPDDLPERVRDNLYGIARQLADLGNPVLPEDIPSLYRYCKNAATENRWELTPNAMLKRVPEWRKQRKPRLVPQTQPLQELPLAAGGEDLISPELQAEGQRIIEAIAKKMSGNIHERPTK